MCLPMHRKNERRLVDRFKGIVLKTNRNTFFYKIPDGFRTGNKPFDVILDAGKVHYLEFKWLPENRKSFKVTSVFEFHQIRTLVKLGKNKSYPCSWGIMQVGRRYYLISSPDLEKDRILLKEYPPLSLEGIAQLLCG